MAEEALRAAAIWDEVKNRLKKSAPGLSGDQQQRLCIARALAVEPEVLLMDESTSALDPISAAGIEDLASELKNKYTVVMVTHNLQQAARIFDNTAFFLLGELVELDRTERVFSAPADRGLYHGEVQLRCAADLKSRWRSCTWNSSGWARCARRPSPRRRRRCWGERRVRRSPPRRRIGDHATNVAEWVEYSLTGVHPSNN